MTFDEEVSKHMEDIKKWCKDPEKIMEYERKIKEAIAQNKVDNGYLETTDTIEDSLWVKIVEAINYDSASTVGWAAKKLAIIYKRTQLGEKLFVPKINTYLEKSNFKDVICQEFSEFIYKEICDSI